MTSFIDQMSRSAARLAGGAGTSIFDAIAIILLITVLAEQQLFAAGMRWDDVWHARTWKRIANVLDRWFRRSRHFDQDAPLSSSVLRAKHRTSDLPSVYARRVAILRSVIGPLLILFLIIVARRIAGFVS